MDGMAEVLAHDRDAPARRRRWARIVPAAALALPLFMLGVSSWIAWRSAWRQASAEVVQTAEAAAEYAARVLSGYAMAVGRINDLVAGYTDAQIREQEAVLHQALRRMIADLPQAEAGFVFDAEGTPILSVNVFPLGTAGMSFMDRDFFVDLSRADAPALHVSRVHRGRLDGDVFIAISRRRGVPGDPLGEGEFHGVVNASVYPAALIQGLAAFRRRASDSLLLFRDDGARLTTSEPDPLGRLADPAPLPRTQPRDLQQDARPGPAAAPRLEARRRVSGFPVYVAVLRPHAEVHRRWWRDMLPQFVIGGPLTLALFLLALSAVEDSRALGRANRDLATALDRSEGWLERVTAGAGLGIWELDAENRFLAASTQLAGLCGLPPHHVFATIDGLLRRLHPADRPGFGAMLDRARAVGRARLEFRVERPRAGREPATAWLVSEAFHIGGGQLAGLTYDITARRLAEGRTVELMQRAVARQEAERLRIARDLHDGLGQHLTLLHLALARQAPDVEELRLLAGEIAREASRLALEIRPTAIDDLGLADALRQLVEDWSARTGIEVATLIALPAARLPPPVETTLYRVLQEALTNVLKHSLATHVGVTLQTSPGRLHLAVEDDGVGLTARPGQEAGRPRLGLRGIRERLEILDGTLELERSPRGGLTLLASIPL
ncbi:ATP-binding protein [Paracraurococcus ruber]|uniref:histidine kinase n=1 Tax=Paracraurococcus ruber TaxID=77675 RepID=A0ABS1D557_9PROT|nr:ATP-binding protein [Paracraurococcus ruber]MBK1662003.1 hypothetical protein [Paracraurococcus ruber]TDG16485.1 hypothetical protein E2C05_29170 [Paracraurococcus ruber]